MVAFGGQTAIKLTQYLDSQGITILGTSADSIDLAEDRARFDDLLEHFGIRRPRGRGVNTLPQALEAAGELGYPGAAAAFLRHWWAEYDHLPESGGDGAVYAGDSRRRH